MKGQRGSRGMVLHFSNLDDRRDGCSTPRPNRITSRNDRILIVQEARWALGQVWGDAENLPTTGVQTPNRTARSESPYRLRYPGPCLSLNNLTISVSHYIREILRNSARYWREKGSSLTAWPLKIGAIGCPETTVNNYQVTLRNISEERISQIVGSYEKFVHPFMTIQGLENFQGL
jgi:hypothetical protein